MTDHTLYDPGLRAALRAVRHYPTEELRLSRIDQLDREAVRKGYRRPPNDTSLFPFPDAATRWVAA